MDEETFINFLRDLQKNIAGEQTVADLIREIDRTIENTLQFLEAGDEE